MKGFAKAPVVTVLLLVLLLGLLGSYTFQLNSRLTSVSTQVEALSQELQAAEGKIANLASASEVAVLGGRLSELDRGISKQLSNLEGKLSQQLSGLSGDLSSFSQQVSQETSQLTESLAEVQSQVGQVEGGLASLRQEVEALGARTSEAGFNAGELYDKVKKGIVEVNVRTASGGQGTGSGFVVDLQGYYVVTNHHVVEDATKIEVTLFDGSIVEGRLVGSDIFSDLAVLKLQKIPAGVEPLAVADSDKVEVGDPVVAVGSPFGLGGSLTSGIVSQKGRLMSTTKGFSIANVIQVDAAINPGNSGGPLLNSHGEVIGVNTAIISLVRAFSGIGFAVPSNMVNKVIPSLIKIGRFEHSWIGIRATELTPSIAQAMNLDVSQGVLVVEVVGGSPAQAANLRAGTDRRSFDGVNINIGGDVIIGIDGVTIKDMADLIGYIDEKKNPGDEVELSIIRKGAQQEIRLTLGVRPLE